MKRLSLAGAACFLKEQQQKKICAAVKLPGTQQEEVGPRAAQALLLVREPVGNGRGQRRGFAGIWVSTDFGP